MRALAYSPLCWKPLRRLEEVAGRRNVEAKGHLGALLSPCVTRTLKSGVLSSVSSHGSQCALDTFFLQVVFIFPVFVQNF